MLSRRSLLARTARVVPALGAAAVAWPAGARALLREAAAAETVARLAPARHAPATGTTSSPEWRAPRATARRRRRPTRPRPEDGDLSALRAGLRDSAGKRGRCRARLNADGELRSLVYGRPISTHVDPSRRNPSTTSCRARPPSRWAPRLPAALPLLPELGALPGLAEDYDVPTSSPADRRRGRVEPRAGRAFTYNEPTVFTEYLLDIAAAARAKACGPRW